MKSLAYRTYMDIRPGEGSAFADKQYLLTQMTQEERDVVASDGPKDINGVVILEGCAIRIRRHDTDYGAACILSAIDTAYRVTGAGLCAVYVHTKGLIGFKDETLIGDPSTDGFEVVDEKAWGDA